MLSNTHELILKRDQIIFNEGDVGDCAYVIDKGRVLVYITKDREEIPISVLGVGEIFGEMSLIDNQNRSASVRALEDVTLTTVSKAQLLERVSSSDNVVQLLMRVLLKRIRRSNSAIRAGSTLGDLEKKSDLDGESQEKSALEQIKLEHQVFEGFQKKEFTLFYQPILDLKSRKIIGAEALLRWISPERGIVAPNVFIDIIENSSMVVPIGNWIIEKAMTDLKTILAKLPQGSKVDPENFAVSINVSSRQFTHSDFVTHIESTREKLNLSSKNIKLEITERVMMDGAIALETLKVCDNHGYHISIDDFGTGFSSIQYLARMPIKYLKIDRSFVMKAISDDKARALVNSILFMAKSLNFNSIAEGIETEAEAKFLTEAGCEYGQGYLFSKPVDLEKFLQLL